MGLCFYKGCLKEHNFYINLVRNRETKLWWAFHRLKESSFYNSGFIHRRCYGAAAQFLNISQSTLLRYLSQLKAKGWVIQCKSGIILTSSRKLSGNKTKPTHNHYDTPEQTRAHIIYAYVLNNMFQQIFKETNKEVKSERIVKKLMRLYKKRKSQLQLDNVHLSCRWFARLLGYKSAMTGVKIERLLKKHKLIRIEGRNKEVCSVELYPKLAKSNPELKFRCFISNGCVFERLTNKITPLL